MSIFDKTAPPMLPEYGESPMRAWWDIYAKAPGKRRTILYENRVSKER